MKANVELCLQRCQGSYRRGVEMVHGLHKKCIHPKDLHAVHDFLDGFESEEDLYKRIISYSLTQISE